MNNMLTPDVMKEIYVILTYCEVIDKIPQDIQEKIINGMDYNYQFTLREDIPIEQQNINKNTISVLTYLYVRYICKDENERDNLLKKMNENEIRYQEELRKKYNPDNLFSNNKNHRSDV